MTEQERRRRLAESLAEVLQHGMRRQDDPALVERLREADARRQRQRLMILFLILGWAFLAWMWLARPAAVFVPLAEQTAGQEEAELRYGLYLQASRIREFVDEHKRLPASLEEAGDVEAGLTWAVADTEWSLVGRSGPYLLELTSLMSADSFLGNSLERLQRR